MRVLGFAVGTTLALGLVAVILSGRLVVVNSPPAPAPAPEPMAAAGDGSAQDGPAPAADRQPDPGPAQSLARVPEAQPRGERPERGQVSEPNSGSVALPPLPKRPDGPPLATAPEPSRPEPPASAPPPMDLDAPAPDRAGESEALPREPDTPATRQPSAPPPPTTPQRARAQPAPEPAEPAAGGDDSGGESPAWDSFWGPFNTRASAAGFASTLSRQTGVEMKAVEEPSGRYMIAFPYRTKEERQSVRDTIAQETGLRLR